MKILVCVKQVIDIEQQLEIRPDGEWITEDEDTRYHMNYLDEFSVEAAVRIKEQIKDVEIDALTIGPDRAESTLRQALALGADNAVHIRYNEDGFLPAETTAFHIAQYLQSAFYDLVLFGVMSEDAMQSLTGPMTAELCGLPCAAAVVNLALETESRDVTVICELEGGFHETVKLPLPTVVCVQSGINQPRYASLSNRLRAKSQEIKTIDISVVDFPEQRQQPVSVFTPLKTGTGEFIPGNPEEKAAALIDILHKKSLI